MACAVWDVANTIAEDGYNTVTRTLLSSILTAAAIGAAAYNTIRAVSIARQEYKIGERYWDIAEDWLDYYKTEYAPVENKELKEARAVKESDGVFDAARGRARAAAWQQFKGVPAIALRRTSRYETGRRQDLLRRMATAQADALALADALGYRNERAYVLARSDERFKKLLETAKRGRNMAAAPVSFASAASTIYGHLYDQAWEGLKGAGFFLGHQLNRKDVRYPLVGIPRVTDPKQVIEDIYQPSRRPDPWYDDPEHPLRKYVNPDEPLPLP